MGTQTSSSSGQEASRVASVVRYVLQKPVVLPPPDSAVALLVKNAALFSYFSS